MIYQYIEMGDKISAEGRAQRGVMLTPRLYHVPATSQPGLSDSKIGFVSFAGCEVLMSF